MDTLNCFLRFRNSDSFMEDIEVSLMTFKQVINDLSCNYQIISHDYEDYKYFYFLKGYECYYIGSCSAWLDN